MYTKYTGGRVWRSEVAWSAWQPGAHTPSYAHNGLALRRDRPRTRRRFSCGLATCTPLGCMQWCIPQSMSHSLHVKYIQYGSAHGMAKAGGEREEGGDKVLSPLSNRRTAVTVTS